MSEDRETERNLGSELRQGAGREWAEELAEDERLTELGRRRRMEMADRAREFVERGQRVRVETGPQTFTGEVVFAGSDYAVIDRADDIAAVKLNEAIWTIEHYEAGGHEQSGGATTMKAHLSELESTGETIRLIVDDGKALLGSIAVVGADHAQVDQDGLPVVVPLSRIVAVVRSKSRR